MAPRTVLATARGQSTSKYLCCVSGSMKLATRSAAVAPHRREPRFFITYGQSERHLGRALIRMSFTRVSARFAWPAPGPPRGGRDRTGGAGAPTGHKPKPKRQQPL